MLVWNNLIDKISEYIRLKGEKLKLEIITQISRLLAHLVAFLFIAVIGVFFLIFASLSLGAYLNWVLDSTFLGYLIVGGLYFIILIGIFFLLRSNKIQNWLETLFISLSENEEFSDEDEI